MAKRRGAKRNPSIKRTINTTRDILKNIVYSSILGVGTSIDACIIIDSEVIPSFSKVVAVLILWLKLGSISFFTSSGMT